MKIAFIAFDLNPTLGSEAGEANLWLKVISKHFKVVAFTLAKHKKDILNEKYINVDFIFIEIPQDLQTLSRKTNLYSISNMVFTKKVKKRLCKYSDIQLIHCITPAGIHSFNSLYETGIPVIAGPIGGALSLPKGFRKRKNFSSFLRNFYYYVIRFCPAWCQYFNHAKVILIGTENITNKFPSKCQNLIQIFFDTAVDPDIFFPLRTKSKKVRICYIGRIESHKGITLLLKSCENLLKDYKNVELTIAGDGSYSDKIPLNNPKIKYVGRITREQVIKLLQNSDIFCLPTLREPGGGAILEAMSCALPVVTTNYGGPAISVTDDCGFKIEPLDEEYYIEQLSSHLKKLIDNPELRKEMGEVGRKRVKAYFSPKSVENKMIKLYKDTVIKNASN